MDSFESQLTFLQHLAWLSMDYTAVYPRTQNSTYPLFFLNILAYFMVIFHKVFVGTDEIPNQDGFWTKIWSGDLPEKKLKC
jgi:hypothetical protein